MFRLNQNEYDYLKTASTAAGARSLSEFVRTRVLLVANELEYADFEGRLDQVNRTLAQLIQLVAKEPSEVYLTRRASDFPD